MIKFLYINKVSRAVFAVILIFPLAAVFLRLGMTFEGFFFVGMLHAGQAIFDNIDFILAISIASVLSIHAKETAGVSGALTVVICKATYLYINPELSAGMFLGIASGILASTVHNNIDKLIGESKGNLYFSAVRMAPIISGGLGFVLGLLIGQIWPALQAGLTQVMQEFMDNPVWGGFVYGTTNRLLLPFGLHSLLNSMVWLEAGEYSQVIQGTLVTVKGDIPRFMAGDPTAGLFQTGYYPIAIFGLPAMALALYRNTALEDRPQVKKTLIVAAASSMIFGVTEPIELLFFVTAFRLYVLHALLTGASMAICQALGIAHGFSFSAGLVDYAFMWNLSTNSYLLLPIGLLFAWIYYILTRYGLKDREVQLVTDNEDRLFKG